MSEVYGLELRQCEFCSKWDKLELKIRGLLGVLLIWSNLGT